MVTSVTRPMICTPSSSRYVGKRTSSATNNLSPASLTKVRITGSGERATDASTTCPLSAPCALLTIAYAPVGQVLRSASLVTNTAAAVPEGYSTVVCSRSADAFKSHRARAETGTMGTVNTGGAPVGIFCIDLPASTPNNQSVVTLYTCANRAISAAPGSVFPCSQRLTALGDNSRSFAISFCVTVGCSANRAALNRCESVDFIAFPWLPIPVLVTGFITY